MRFFMSARLLTRDSHRVLYACALLLIAISLTVFAVGRHQNQRSLAQLEVRLNGRSTANSGILARQVEHLRRDVQFMGSVPAVAGIIRASGNGGYDAAENTPIALWNQRLKSIFSAYAVANPDIFQVSLIGMGNNGRELIRVDRRAGNPVVVPSDQLQAKGDTSYVKATAQLRAGQTYLSDVTLNREHGQLITPHMAMLRAASPIYGTNGKLFGVLVLSYDVSNIMVPLRANMPPYFQAYLTNGQGDFLLHPDPARAYGFDLGRRWRWQDEFQATMDDDHLSTILRRYFYLGEMVYVSAKKVVLDPDHPERDLMFAIAVSNATVAEEKKVAQFEVLAAMLASVMLVGGANLYLRQRRLGNEYQARLSAIVESSHDAIIGKTLDGIVTSWNHGAELMFGYGAKEAVGMHLMDLIIPFGAAAEERDILRRIGRGEGVVDFSTIRRRKDGTLFHVSVTSSPIRAGDGQIVGAAKTVRDISEQVAANRSIRVLNTTLQAEVRARTRQIESVTILQRAILDHASYSLIATDTHGIILLFNPAAERMLGYAEAEVLGKQTPEIFHDRGEVVARAAALSQELAMTVVPGFDVFVAKARLGMSDESEWTYIRKDGSRFPALLSVNALRGGDGAINGYLGIASDISMREQDRRKLIAARDQLLDASHVAELGIWTWALADDVIEWNEWMYEFYDVPLAQRGSGLRYADWCSHVHPEDVDGAFAKLKGAIAGTDKYDPVFRVLRSDGQIRYIQAAASIERDAQGKAVRVLGINRDITSHYEAEAALRAAKLAADGASRTKSAFLANMSHEIRSPMNAVLGMLMLLKQTALDPRQRDYASNAEGAGRALLGILNDILDFSRIEAGKLTLDPHPFNIDQLLREVGVILSVNVGEKKIDLLYELDSALPDWVVGDAMRLQQVLINLAGNAVKFTQQGEVVVKARVLPLNDGDELSHGPHAVRLGFAIRDTGIGIAPDKCQHIFGGFEQAEASTARRFGGSGLGLAISQRLVALMDGPLTVESTLGQGSTFSFSVACQLAPAPQRLTRRDAVRLQGLKCLVVDDHAAARESMISMLRRFGWGVDGACSCFDALAAIRRCGAGAYDVVFVDWHMHGMDGWETSARIRLLLPPQHATLIIMVAAHGRRVHALHQETDHAVLDGFLVKPITGSMLFDAVADALAASDGNASEAPGTDSGQRRLAGLHLLLVEDNPVNQQVARELLSHDGASVEVASDGRAAIEAVRKASPQFDCVLMDIQMPEMDGYAAARAIRGELGMAALPIIAMTANAMDSDRTDAFAAGMNDHVGKPFGLAHMIATILHHTGRAPADICTRDDSASAAVGDLLRPGFNGVEALARFGGNALFYRRALHNFVAKAAMLLAELPETFAEASRSAAAAALHSLKGLAGTVGAEAVADAAHSIERSLHAGPSPAIWALGHAQLLTVSRQAVISCAELAEQLDASCPPEAARPPPDTSALPAALFKLQQLLEASNLDALPLFEGLLRDYGESMRSEFFALNSAIEQCDFAVAAQQCDAILGQL